MSERSGIGAFLFEGGAAKVLGTAGTVLGAAQQIDSLYRTQPINRQGDDQARLQMEMMRLQAAAAAEAAAREEEQRRRRRQQQMLTYGGAAVAVLLLVIILTKKK